MRSSSADRFDLCLSRAYLDAHRSAWHTERGGTWRTAGPVASSAAVRAHVRRARRASGTRMASWVEAPVGARVVRVAASQPSDAAPSAFAARRRWSCGAWARSRMAGGHGASERRPQPARRICGARVRPWADAVFCGGARRGTGGDDRGSGDPSYRPRWRVVRPRAASPSRRRADRRRSSAASAGSSPVSA